MQTLVFGSIHFKSNDLILFNLYCLLLFSTLFQCNNANSHHTFINQEDVTNELSVVTFQSNIVKNGNRNLSL